ncbi:hypothetical protein PORCRE_45 [Porphyromonas crevioricanis JCM 15906]|uniref:Uncharacterized protein n=1 Tax=Porphyromonas crevioricanis JCM 15906 TaxID=1305617 RepID=S4NFM4_9PORP|nr:hypothetical protein PORCRE_45 [Porphyromonas crevioricanis JCM 15906]GAD07785.1 hypothetical protein PORCAN_1412 [Porphyromonas crevioricanis JCM 13913]
MLPLPREHQSPAIAIILQSPARSCLGSLGESVQRSLRVI